MEKQPEEITVCNLSCVLMPQGEVICRGKTVGWFKDLKSYLEPATDLQVAASDLLEACEMALPLIAGERIAYGSFSPTNESAVVLMSKMVKCENELKAAIAKAKP